MSDVVLIYTDQRTGEIADQEGLITTEFVEEYSGRGQVMVTRTPYLRDFITLAKKRRGWWDAQLKAWVIPYPKTRRTLEKFYSELTEIYRTDEGQRAMDEARSKKAKRDADAEAAKTSEHLGTIGMHLTVTGTVRTAKMVDGAYGRSMWIIVQLPNNSLVETYTTAKWTSTIYTGDTVTLSGTVKKHRMFYDFKTTRISRPKLESKGMPANTDPVVEAPTPAPEQAAPEQVAEVPARPDAPQPAVFEPLKPQRVPNLSPSAVPW